MNRTFAQELLHFARAADSLKAEDFRRVREVVQDYLQTNFALSKVEFLLETVAQGRRGLEPKWADEDAYGAYPVLTDDKKPNGQNAYALLAGKPLWIVGEKQGNLDDERAFVDYWNGDDSIPPFRRFERSNEFNAPQNSPKMLIAIPLRSRGESYGVLSCESDEIYTPNAAAQTELEAIAEALSILHFLRRHRYNAELNTGHAIKELAKIADEPIEFKTRKPKVFYAYGKDKDPEVSGSIREVLRAYDSYVTVVDWQEAKPPGDISDWITSEIMSAKYMICYLSDLLQKNGGAPHYVDNPNVIFETGMFHALRENSEISARQWLPVREGPPEEAPFDFRTMQAVAVPRDKGRFLKDAFVTELRKAVQELIATEISRDSDGRG